MELKQGLCKNLEGWDGEGDGRFKRDGTYVYLWLIHVDIWQRTTKFCKAVILRLKNKLIFKKERPKAPGSKCHSQGSNTGLTDSRSCIYQLPDPRDPGWSDHPRRKVQKGCPPGGKGRNCQCLARVFEGLRNHPGSIVPILQMMKESLQKSRVTCPKSCNSQTAELGFKLSSLLCLLL